MPKNRITKIIFQKLFGTITAKNIAIFGFSFKSNTNDTRESPAIEICNQLMHEGANLKIYDPRVSINQLEKDLGLNKKDERKQGFFNGSWKFVNDSYKAAEGTDAIVVLTEWEEFKHLDWKLISTNMRSPSWVFDTRSIINFKEAKSHGFNTWIIGRS